MKPLLFAFVLLIAVGQHAVAESLNVMTWNGFKAIVPHHRIDFVFTTKSVSVNRFQTIDDQRESRFPSDHLPVVTELELMKE